MDEQTIRERTFCCGGGGGLLTDDLREIPVKGAKPRVETLNDVMQENGITHMAAICAICKRQLSKVLPFYGMEMDQIVSADQLVSIAIILTVQETERARGGRRSGLNETSTVPGFFPSPSESVGS